YMLTVQGTVHEDLNIYGTEFKSVLESFGLSDNECCEMITRKISQVFGPAEQKENDDHPIWSSSD
ncbi:MAG TPA: hypothetical protein VLH87_00720, partial [Pyrinomonadaceae bacterium]|nr:hypothetical protein [Pyrinomonadaceae bacterium]